MNMPKMAVVFGVLLAVLGLGGYFGAAAGWIAGGHASPTALIPVAFGIMLFVCGIVGANPGYKKHAMHGAAVVALLGVIGAIGRPIALMAKGELKMSAALVTQLIMAILSAVFLAMCVRSFINARKERETMGG